MKFSCFITFSSTINWTCQSSRQAVKPYSKCVQKVTTALFIITPNVVFGKYCIFIDPKDLLLSGLDGSFVSLTYLLGKCIY